MPEANTGRRRDLGLVDKSMAGVLLGDFKFPDTRSSTSNLHFPPSKNVGRVIQCATKVMVCKFLVGNTAV